MIALLLRLEQLPDSGNSFLRDTDKLAQDLAFLIHVTSGGPSQASSMTETQIRNTHERMQSVMVWDGSVMLVIRYAKPQAVTHRAHGSIKCICPEVALELLRYVVLIKPLADYISLVLARNAKIPEFALEDRFTQLFPFSEDKFRTFVTENLHNDCSSMFNFSLYRHYFQVMTRRHFALPIISETNAAILNYQLDHSAATGLHYGVTALDARGGRAFVTARTASRQWQQFLGLETESAQRQLVLNKSDHPIQATNLTVAHNTRNVTQYFVNMNTNGLVPSSSLPQNTISQSSIMDAQGIMVKSFQKFVPTPYRTLFQSKEMRFVFHTIFSSHGDFVAVLPTGSGKSCLLHYPAHAASDEQMVIIAIVPLKELLADQILQAEKMNVNAILYDKSQGMEINVKRLNEKRPVLFLSKSSTSGVNFSNLRVNLIVAFQGLCSTSVI